MEGVLELLEVRDLLNLSLVCKQLYNEVLESSFYWKKVHFNCSKCPPYEFEKVDPRRKQNLRLQPLWPPTFYQTKRLNFALEHADFSLVRILAFDGGYMRCKAFTRATSLGRLSNLRELKLYLGTGSGNPDKLGPHTFLERLDKLTLFWNDFNSDPSDFVQSILDNSPRLSTLHITRLPGQPRPYNFDLTKCRNLKNISIQCLADLYVLLKPVAENLETLVVANQNGRGIPNLPRLRELTYGGRRVSEITKKNFPSLKTFNLLPHCMLNTHETQNCTREQVFEKWRLWDFPVSRIEEAFLYYQCIPDSMLPEVQVNVKNALIGYRHKNLWQLMSSRFKKIHLTLSSDVTGWLFEEICQNEINESATGEKGTLVIETSHSKFPVDFEEDFVASMHKLSRRYDPITVLGFRIPFDLEKRLRERIENLNVKLLYCPIY